MFSCESRDWTLTKHTCEFWCWCSA